MPDVGEICQRRLRPPRAGSYSVHPRYGPQLAVRRLRAAEPDEVDLDALCDGPPRSAAQMEADLREILATIQNPHLRALLDAIFGPARPRGSCSAPPPPPSATTRPTATACSSTACRSRSRCRRSPRTSRASTARSRSPARCCTTSASSTPTRPTGVAIDLTDLGKLQGEIPLGYYRIRRLIEDLPGFPEQLAAAVLHIILSHHGALEHGSPVVPCTREATLVHMIDNLGGRLGSFDRLEKELPQGSRWSGFDRALGRRRLLRRPPSGVAKSAQIAAKTDGCRPGSGYVTARLQSWAVAKDTEKLIRQLSLISYLMAERRPVTATEIRRDVEGYSDMTEDAFARRFYADRAELDALGIQLRVDKPAEGFSEQENYSLAPEAFHLPAIAFTDEEHASLQTALSLLDGEFAYAEPLRLALQQITWGRPSPLDSPDPARRRLGITGGRRRRGLRPPGEDRHRDLPPQADRVRVLHDAVGRGRAAPRRPLPAALPGRPVLPRRPLARARGVRVFRLSRIRGKVAYATKAEHDFQRPTRLRPARVRQPHPVAARRDLGTAEICVSDRIAWHVERNFGPYGEMARPTTPYLPHRLRDPAAADRLGARPRRARPHHRPARARREARERLDAIVERHTGEPFTSVAEGKPARRRRPGRREAPTRSRAGGRDPARALRPPGHARLGADRRRPRRPPRCPSPRSSSGCRSPSRSCARTSRCSTSSTSAAAPTCSTPRSRATRSRSTPSPTPTPSTARRGCCRSRPTR